MLDSCADEEILKSIRARAHELRRLASIASCSEMALNLEYCADTIEADVNKLDGWLHGRDGATMAGLRRA
jgi:hypothetical protein